jgi:hypothetical protein
MLNMSVKKSAAAAPREGTASAVREASRSGIPERATSPERPKRRSFTAEYKLRIGLRNFANLDLLFAHEHGRLHRRHDGATMQTSRHRPVPCRW